LNPHGIEIADLAAHAALVLAEPSLDAFYQVKLVKPFKKNLDIKNKRMKSAIDTYSKLVDYEVGDVTAAATFHLAEIYFHFSRALMDSERPDNLSLTETVVTMAGLSKFVVVDLSGSSVPAELQAILGQIKKPVLAFGDPFALFPDLEDQTSVVTIEGPESDLLGGIEEKLSEIEGLHSERIMQLAKRYTKADRKRLLRDSGE